MQINSKMTVLRERWLLGFMEKHTAKRTACNHINKRLGKYYRSQMILLFCLKSLLTIKKNQVLFSLILREELKISLQSSKKNTPNHFFSLAGYANKTGAENTNFIKKKVLISKIWPSCSVQTTLQKWNFLI